MKTTLTILALFVTSLIVAQPKTGEEVITEMYKRNNKSLYRFMTFEQQTVFYENEMFKKQEKWYEAIGFPGKLIIKIDSMNSGKGMLFANDSMFVFEGGKLKKADYKVHDLLWLCFDVYFINPEESIPLTAELGYDVTKMYETNHFGRPVYAVGASDENDKSNQFWIDKERLALIKTLKYDEKGNTSEVIFDKFMNMGSLWTGTQLTFKKNGEKVMEERYNNIKFSSNFNTTVFAPKNFGKAKW